MKTAVTAKSQETLFRKRTNRSTRHVTASPSILKASQELVLFRKRLFMSQSVFAARLSISIARLRACESGLEILDSHLKAKLSDLAEVFCVDADALKAAIIVRQLPIFDLLFCADNVLTIEALNNALERLNISLSLGELTVILDELRALECVSFDYTRGMWAQRKRITDIQITAKGARCMELSRARAREETAA